MALEPSAIKAIVNTDMDVNESCEHCLIASGGDAVDLNIVLKKPPRP